MLVARWSLTNTDPELSRVQPFSESPWCLSLENGRAQKSRGYPLQGLKGCGDSWLGGKQRTPVSCGFPFWRVPLVYPRLFCTLQDALFRTLCKRKAQSLRCQVREHRGGKKQGKDIPVEVMDMHRINYGLDCHDQPVHDAGPNGE